jgi:hypothetical protein
MRRMLTTGHDCTQHGRRDALRPFNSSTQNRRKARVRARTGITEASLWRYEREPQRAWLVPKRIRPVLAAPTNP